jgi:nicotinamide-nucleotide amidase
VDDDLVETISRRARQQGLRVAVAESLTAGTVSAALGRGEGAAEWFSGAVVAYDAEVKFAVLGVARGPVVTESCAREMAEGVRSLLGADVGIGITGVGGPGPEEDCPAGTIHLAVAAPSGTHAVHVCSPGEPAEVVAAATDLALGELCRALEDAG